MPTQMNPLAAEVAHNPEAPAVLRPRRDRAPAGRVVRPLRHAWYPACKAAADFLIGALLSAAALPVVAACAAVVKLTSPGPAFYTQTRVGRGGRTFTIYKLRSMVHNCESLTGPRWSLPGDPRVTRFGWFLRVSHLDELPQLVNVLRGEMALVGPRPERPEFLPELERELPAYRQRLAVRPGVTGFAQVQLPADTDVDSVRRKLAYDLFYVERLGPWLDLRLLLATPLYAAGVPFPTLRRLFRLPDRPVVERAMQGVVPEPPPARVRASA